MIKLLFWILVLGGIWMFLRSQGGTSKTKQQDLRQRQSDNIIDVEAEVIEVKRKKK